MELYQTIINWLFRFSYPVGFIGAIMYSINSMVSIDFFSAFFNKGIIIFINVYVGLCGYIAFCTFYQIQVDIGGFVVDFDHIFIAVDKDPNKNNAPVYITNKAYNIAPGQTQISLTG